MEQAVEPRLDAHHLHALVDAVDALISIKDSSGRYLLVNRQFENFTGMARGQILGKTDNELFAPDTAAVLAESDHDVIESRQGLQVEQRIGLLGRPRCLLCRKFPLVDAAGRIYAVGSVANDIAPRQDRQTEFAELTALAALRARDEFLFALSHDLRTPLNAMVGWLNNLVAGTDRSQAVVERAIEGLRRGIDQQRRLVEDLLDTARILSGSFEFQTQPVAVAAVVDAALATIRTQANAKHLGMCVTPSEDQPWVMADAARLEQALSTLLANAVECAPETGELAVRTALVGDRVQIMVTDAQEAVDVESPSLPFEPVKPGGTHPGALGLGLMLAKTLVELQGGRISAHRPRKGQGSTFTISLSAIAMPHADPAKSPE